jgi:hypothetical protein
MNALVLVGRIIGSPGLSKWSREQSAHKMLSRNL